MGAHKVLLLIFVILLVEVYCEKPFKICAKNKIEECAKLGRTDDVACVNNPHNTDCILNIQQEKTDFGRITAEQALVAAKFVDNVVVIGEFRSDAAIHDDSASATVVLVRADHTDGLKGLKGKKYCHPGFKFDEIITEGVLKEFENTVLKANGVEGCSYTVESGTLLEKELLALSDFFGPSCRPGPWVGLEDSDRQFYQRYPKLCELCISADKCTIQSGAVPFIESLECLVNGGGDLALTTLNSAKEFFNRSANINKAGDYRYLCRDGSTANLDSVCTWSKQPWELIIANGRQAASIKTELEGWLSKSVIVSGPTPFSTNEIFEESLKDVLFPSEKQYNKIKFVSDVPSLKDYIERYRTIPNERDNGKCDQKLRWCTTSKEEQQKCEWLSQASLNYAIQPPINCILSTNNLTCLEDIKVGKADVVASDAHFGYIARRKGLAPLSYPATSVEHLIKPIVVIKDSNNLNIQRFENLKTRKGCFPEYGGIEWLSFINTARVHKVLSKTTCDYGELISEFVGDSCMPGAHDIEHEISDRIDKDKLCNLCVPDPNAKTASTCNTDNTNKYYGNAGALKCLKDLGDFAVITKGAYPNMNSSEFRVLCQNGSLASNTGFDVDENCVLVSIIDSEVVSKRNNPKNADLRMVLLNFERRFGTDRVKAFEVFSVFNNTYDLLFKESTLGLTYVNSDTTRIRNYAELFKHIDKCTEGNDSGDGASALSRITMLPLITTFILWKLVTY